MKKYCVWPIAIVHCVQQFVKTFFLSCSVCVLVCSSATLYPCITLYLSLPNDDRNGIFDCPINFVLARYILCTSSIHFDEDSISDFFSFKFQGFYVLRFHSFTFTIHIDHFILSKLSITHLVCTLVFLIFSSLFSHCLSTEQIKSYWYKNTHICTHATVHRDHID